MEIHWHFESFSALFSNSANCSSRSSSCPFSICTQLTKVTKLKCSYTVQALLIENKYNGRGRSINNPSQPTWCFSSVWLAVELKYQQPFTNLLKLNRMAVLCLLTLYIIAHHTVLLKTCQPGWRMHSSFAKSWSESLGMNCACSTVRNQQNSYLYRRF